MQGEKVPDRLVITHEVGAMRKYCLGASLFHLNDPSKELGRLKEPLLMPEEDERYGYVPNVVYSCGAIIHQDKLFIPYAVSDYATSFATIPFERIAGWDNEYIMKPLSNGCFIPLMPMPLLHGISSRPKYFLHPGSN